MPRHRTQHPLRQGLHGSSAAVQTLQYLGTKPDTTNMVLQRRVDDWMDASIVKDVYGTTWDWQHADSYFYLQGYQTCDAITYNATQPMAISCTCLQLFFTFQLIFVPREPRTSKYGVRNGRYEMSSDGIPAGEFDCRCCWIRSKWNWSLIVLLYQSILSWQDLTLNKATCWSSINISLHMHT
jgi:hypothetical protein